MKLKNVIAVGTLLASTVAMADSYQFDVGANASRLDLNGLSSKSNSHGVTGSYYFNPVSTTNLPLAEAAFLGKNSDVYASATRVSWRGDRGDVFNVGAEFFIPENFLYVSGGLLKAKRDGESADNDWYTSVGVTPIDGLLVSTFYSHDAGYDANIHGKYVTDIGNGHFINLTAGLSDADDGTMVDIGGDFYLDNSFSVGGEIVHQDSDNAYTVRARKFFTEQFSGQLAYTDAPAANEIAVAVSMRF